MCHVFQRIAEWHIVWYDSPTKTVRQRMDHTMEIRKVESDQKRYLDLLLLADEQEDMIDRYLKRGTIPEKRVWQTMTSLSGPPAVEKHEAMSCRICWTPRSPSS